MIKIVKYPQNKIETNNYNHLVFNFFPNRNFKNEIIIAPHNQETFINIQLYKLFIWCDKNNIKITTIGSINQLPLMSLISHQAILQPTDVSQLFNSHSSFAVDITKYEGLYNFEDVYDGNNIYVQKCQEVSDVEVINFYKNPAIFINENSYNLFINKKWEESKICCELKQSHYQDIISKFEKIKCNTLIGLDKKFQKTLVLENKQEYMTFQILLSIIKGWKFISAGGATNLFCIIPVNCIFMVENIFDFSLSAQRIKKELNMYYYGSMPHTLSYDNRLYYEQGDFKYIPDRLLENCLKIESTQPSFVVFSYEEFISTQKNIQKYLYKRTGFTDSVVELREDGTVGNTPGTWEAYWKEENGKIYLHDKTTSRIELDKSTLKGKFINCHLNGVLVSLEPC